MKNIQKIADEIFKAPTRKELMERWIKYADLIKNSDGTYDCNRDVAIANNIVLTKSKKLAIKFHHVHGHFICSKINLTSLEGCPKIVGGFFDCSVNDLISLKGAPQKVKGYFDCRDNKKKFTQEEVKAVCDVGGTIYAYKKDGVYSFLPDKK
jgi:hypothetical protein